VTSCREQLGDARRLETTLSKTERGTKTSTSSSTIVHDIKVSFTRSCRSRPWLWDGCDPLTQQQHRIRAQLAGTCPKSKTTHIYKSACVCTLEATLAYIDLLCLDWASANNAPRRCGRTERALAAEGRELLAKHVDLDISSGRCMSFGRLEASRVESRLHSVRKR
jgi:hypothetical protein